MLTGATCTCAPECDLNESCPPMNRVVLAVWKNHLRQSGISTLESLAAEEERGGRGRSKARLWHIIPGLNSRLGLLFLITCSLSSSAFTHGAGIQNSGVFLTGFFLLLKQSEQCHCCILFHGTTAHASHVFTTHLGENVSMEAVIRCIHDPNLWDRGENVFIVAP